MYWRESNTSMVIEADEVLRYTSDTDDDPHIAIWLEPPLQVHTGPGPFPPPTASGPFPSLTNFGTLDFVTSNHVNSFLIVFRPMPASSEGTVIHNAGLMSIEARDGGATGILGTDYHSFRFENSGQLIVRGVDSATGFRSLSGDIVNQGLIDVQGDISLGIVTRMDSSIHNTGDILVAGSHTSVAVVLSLANSTVHNSGLIRADKLDGSGDSVGISAAPLYGVTSIVNDGEITADYAIRSTSERPEAAVDVINRGQITGAVVLAGSTIDTLVNEGVIDGFVYLGGGADLYDGRLGEISGPVDGGAGDDILLGGAGSDTFYGGDGNDHLDGGGGIDTMAGGAGDDIYYVDHVRDQVIERGGEGYDLVYSTVSFNLNGQSIEAATLLGSRNTNLTGNAGHNVLTGNSGNNVIDGGGGIDTMAGGAGDDIYYVDHVRDVVIERGGAGYDLVYSTVSFDLNGQSIEAATLLGSRNANLTGNAGHNVLTGNSGNNVIDGGGGIDTMAGGAGDDIYYVDHVRDQVIERGGEGYDLVYSTVSFNLNGQSIEAATLLGARNANLTGNAGHNVLTGNSGANIIIGGGGVDTIDGGAGNDVLNGGARRDYLTGGAGSDRFVYTNVSDSSYADYDRIMDLSDEDIIDLSGIDADINTEGDQAFALVDSFTGQAGQITLTYNAGAGFTVLAADVNGDGLADMRIVLYGNHEDFSNFWL